MDVKLRAFWKQAREENRGRTSLRRHYSRQLRLDAVAYLKRKKGQVEPAFRNVAPDFAAAVDIAVRIEPKEARPDA